MFNQFQNIFPRAFPESIGVGRIKQLPDDFVVEEELAFPFSGEGEHVYLQIRKTSQNTMWAAGLLAKHFSVKERDIGYAGLKDRHAITTQWMSLPAKFATDEKIKSFACPDIDIIDVQRHTGKLRKGAIKNNRFKIIVRNIKINDAELKQRLESIIQTGVPNYFDEQRFGLHRQNLIAAEKMFKGEFRPRRAKQRLYLSAARSWLFNLILAKRVITKCWSSGLDGDVFILDGSKKYFHAEYMDEILANRIIANDIHPTAALWGCGELQTTSEARRLELSIFDNWTAWCRQLEKSRMNQQRRALRVMPGDLQHVYDSNNQLLELCFSLPAGAYATNVIRELISIEDVE